MLSLDLRRPVWAEIHLDRLAHNFRQVKQQVGSEKEICAVVKANGYGHGAVIVARELEKEGVDRLAVATLNEGIELRSGGCRLPILVMGYTPDELASEMIRHGLIATIYTIQQGNAFSNMAQRMGQKCRVHIKVDSGMSRLGFQVTTESVDAIKKICQLPGVDVEGIFTHFAAADEKNKSETHRQLDRFMWLVEETRKTGCRIPIRHAANSAAIIDYPASHLDMVRPGIMLYGLYPSEEVDHEKVKLRRVMALKSRIAHLKTISPGTGVSYGLTYRATRETAIATLPVGYADGYTRMLGGKAEVSMNGRKAPVVGRICMDQCMVDVTGMDVSLNNEVTLYALETELGDTVDDVARKLSTNNYEIVCMIGRRVPRAYYNQGILEKVTDPLVDHDQ